MLLPVAPQKVKGSFLSSREICRYVRTINLLPGVERGSQAKRKRERGASQGRREERTVVGVVYKRGVGEYTVMI